MKKTLGKISRLLIISAFLFFPLVFVSSAGLGDAFSSNTLGQVANSAQFDTNQQSPEDIISIGIAAALSLLGIIFVILIVYSGIIWMTAGGNEEQITKAKNTIKQSIIGLVIVIAAYAISYFVLSAFTSSTGQLGVDSSTITNTTVNTTVSP